MVMGYFEAQAIAIEMNALKATRPLTFDLLQTLLLAGNFSVKEIVIDAIINQLFYATVVLQTMDGELELDTIPSDAFVIALKNKAPMYIYRSVLKAYQDLELNKS
ncbi:bifunctional nuclease family protein [Spirosoma foliorum]|uniref:Bifunctional nuclease family protein n=2 Tax=Spirosoma foliorum TaxID=2710596 RepID=A0A7G5GRJ2_9BACT|nr:bifunctional nuclease family protein [Spirosoma foliorum]